VNGWTDKINGGELELCGIYGNNKSATQKWEWENWERRIVGGRETDWRNFGGDAGSNEREGGDFAGAALTAPRLVFSSGSGGQRLRR
jgi:hypothetical protein